MAPVSIGSEPNLPQLREISSPKDYDLSEYVNRTPSEWGRHIAAELIKFTDDPFAQELRAQYIAGQEKRIEQFIDELSQERDGNPKRATKIKISRLEELKDQLDYPLGEAKNYNDLTLDTWSDFLKTEALRLSDETKSERLKFYNDQNLLLIEEIKKEEGIKTHANSMIRTPRSKKLRSMLLELNSGLVGIMIKKSKQEFLANNNSAGAETDDFLEGIDSLGLSAIDRAITKFDPERIVKDKETGEIKLDDEGNPRKLKPATLFTHYIWRDFQKHTAEFYKNRGQRAFSLDAPIGNNKDEAGTRADLIEDRKASFEHGAHHDRDEAINSLFDFVASMPDFRGVGSTFPMSAAELFTDYANSQKGLDNFVTDFARENELLREAVRQNLTRALKYIRSNFNYKL